MLRYLTKSRVGFILALPSWGLLFLAFVYAIIDIFQDTPTGVHVTKTLYFNLCAYSGVILFLASVILATWGLKKDKLFSILTYAVHVTVVIVSLFF